MSDRASFPIYKIERDNFDGRLNVRLSFVPLGATCVRVGPEARVLADDLDGGPAGTITAPAGSRLIEFGDGTIGVETPDGTPYTANEAFRAALADDRAHSCGFGWSPNQDAEVA